MYQTTAIIRKPCLKSELSEALWVLKLKREL